MCGIIAYIGRPIKISEIVSKLQKLEYRGYDSAGIATIVDGLLYTDKAIGKVSNISIDTLPSTTTIAIAHTRWATHGKPTVLNAHPHVDCKHNIAIVHNGIIDNYTTLRKQLSDAGHVFETETDSEVIAHLIEKLYDGDLEKAVKAAIPILIGTYGLAAIHINEPDKIVLAKMGSSLLLSQNWATSDCVALDGQQAVQLADGDMAVLTADGYRLITDKTNRDYIVIDNIGQPDKAPYDHFMLKEILEQPKSIANLITGKLVNGDVVLGGISKIKERLLQSSEIIFTGCGTAYNACLLAKKLLFNNFISMPISTEFAGELDYQQITQRTTVIGISQSGETYDTLTAIKAAKLKGALTIGIVNTVGSTIARETDAGIYLHAGPEIGVASTKAFTSQLIAIILFGLYLNNRRSVYDGLIDLPNVAQKTIDMMGPVKGLIDKYLKYGTWLYLGRGYNYPLALEGALKLKEVSYIHAEGFSFAEMKHGPIALITDEVPVVCIIPNDKDFNKAINNVAEVAARGGRIIAITTEGTIIPNAEEIIYVPRVAEELQPTITAIPLQLMAYYTAVGLNRDVDRPRNLAKSVTVG